MVLDKGLSFSFQSGVGLGGWYRNEWVFYFYFCLKKADRGTDVVKYAEKSENVWKHTFYIKKCLHTSKNLLCS